MKEFTEKQKKLLQWRDYFLMLHEGLNNKKDVEEINTWVAVFIAEIESDIKHIDNEQEQYCRFDKPKDLSQIDSNIRIE